MTLVHSNVSLVTSTGDVGDCVSTAVEANPTALFSYFRNGHSDIITVLVTNENKEHSTQQRVDPTIYEAFV